MADTPKRRKFKCPNCAHIVRFQVDPERTLIACDHCGQLTRVTMKASQSEEKPSANIPSSNLVSQAFEDLDLEGLEHRDSVVSSTLGAVDVRGNASPKTTTTESSDRSKQTRRPNAQSKISKSGKQAEDLPAPQTQQNGENSDSIPEQNTREPIDVGLGAPLPPPYTPPTPTAYQDVPLPPSPAVPPQPNDEAQSDAMEPLPPITFNLNHNSGESWSVNPEQTSHSPDPLVLPENDQHLLDANQSAAPTDQYVTSDPNAWQGEIAESADNEAELDMEFLDPIGQAEMQSAEIHSQANQEDQQPLSIPEGMEFVETRTPSSESEDVRIMCRVCDTLSYFPPSDEYVCQDCYSRIDENGMPIREKKQRSVAVEPDRPKDEIDDLISTAIDADEPTQDALWQAKESAGENELIEDTDGLLEEDQDEQNEDEDEELRLAPLDAPTEDYRSSVLPHGFKPDETTAEETETNKSDVSEADDSSEVNETEMGSDEVTGKSSLENETSATAKFQWRHDSDLDEQLSTHDSLPIVDPETPNQESADSLPEVIDTNDNKASEVNTPDLEQDSDDELRLEAPEIEYSDKSEHASNQPLFLDGGDNQSESFGQNGDQAADNLIHGGMPQFPAAPNQPVPSPNPAAGVPQVPTPQVPTPQVPTPGPTTKVPTPPVPPPFLPDQQNPSPQNPGQQPEQHVPNQQYSEQRVAPTTTVAEPTVEGFHAYRDSRQRPKQQPEPTEPESTGSPLEYGWAGNWLPLLSSIWVIGGVAAVSFGLALSLWLLSAMAAPDNSVVARALLVAGLAVTGIPTGVLWVWLFSVVVDQKQQAVGAEVFDFNRFVVHAMRLALCFAMCLPGLFLGWLAGFPVLGSMIALFYTSPLAIYLNSISQYSGRPVSFYDKEFVQHMFQHQDVWLSGIGVVGMVFVVCCPFVGLGAYIPMPGVLLAAPALVLFSVVLGLQVVRLTETMKVLVQMDTKA